MAEELKMIQRDEYPESRLFDSDGIFCMLRYLFQPVFGICLELTLKEGVH